MNATPCVSLFGCLWLLGGGCAPEVPTPRPLIADAGGPAAEATVPPAAAPDTSVGEDAAPDTSTIAEQDAAPPAPTGPAGPFGDTVGMTAANVTITDCAGQPFDLHAEYDKQPATVILYNWLGFS